MAGPTRKSADQIPLPLSHDGTDNDDVIPGKANAAVRDMLASWSNWQAPGLVISGPARSGKSGLLAEFARANELPMIAGTDLSQIDILALLLDERSSVIVDDADRAPEDALFHLYNHCKAQGQHLLLSAEQAPSAWGCALPDLKSRLLTLPVVEIEQPDDELMLALLMRKFADRQLQAPMAVIEYLGKRIERTYQNLEETVAEIDRQSLAEGRNVTLPLARQVIEKQG